MTKDNAVVTTCRYRHPELGAVHVKVHGTTHHIKARWIGQELCITIPPNLPLSEYNRFLDSLRPRLLEMKPRPHFDGNRHIDGSYADFIIDFTDSLGKRDVQICPDTSTPTPGKEATYLIKLNSRLLDMVAEASVQTFVNSALLSAARHATATYIVPRARQLAEKHGCRPSGWKVKETRTRLGCCSSRRIITLSPRLIFLPLELADFIICHELAHLTEMNHSAAFHRLCDSYCDGREAQLNARLRAFKFPVY